MTDPQWSEENVIRYLRVDYALAFDEAQFNDDGAPIDGANLVQKGPFSLLSWIGSHDRSVRETVKTIVKGVGRLVQHLSFQAALTEYKSHCANTISEAEVEFEDLAIGSGGDGTVASGRWKEQRVAIKVPLAKMDRDTMAAEEPAGHEPGAGQGRGLWAEQAQRHDAVELLKHICGHVRMACSGGQSVKSSDVWGLGCVVLFLKTGKGPWHHFNNERNTIWQALIREKKVPRPDLTAASRVLVV